ncbi:hypothetical protein QQP08_004349 [Theobroma cacao]|nr:hypothetical protein QQP08_004349 [Theobroma cacao]
MGTVELVMLFSSGPGSASLALHERKLTHVKHAVHPFGRQDFATGTALGLFLRTYLLFAGVAAVGSDFFVESACSVADSVRPFLRTYFLFPLGFSLELMFFVVAGFGFLLGLPSTITLGLCFLRLGGFCWGVLFRSMPCSLPLSKSLFSSTGVEMTADDESTMFWAKAVAFLVAGRFAKWKIQPIPANFLFQIGSLARSPEWDLIWLRWAFVVLPESKNR